MIKGIDVSKYQKNIDWKKVADSGVKVAIIRAGYGQSQVDSKFKANIEGALANGIEVGVYWFIYAKNTQEAVKNAEKCFATISAYKSKITRRVWADWEYDSDAKAPGLSKAQRTQIVVAFVETLKNLGLSVGVYANPDYLNTKFNDLSSYPLWLAQYGPKKSKDCEMWQYSSTGKVNGIDGNVDLDEVYGMSDAKVHVTSNRVLKKGMSGSDVIVLQKSLLAKGYYNGKIDGVYGDGTAKAVLLLQYDSFPDSKDWDAMVGPKTWSLI